MREKCSCSFPKIKKNYPFGRKSKATKVCKRCKNVVTNHDIMLIKRNKKQNDRKRR